MLPREIDSIWRKGWRKQCIGRLLYIISRYSTFFTLGTIIYSSIGRPSHDLCLGLGISSAWATLIGLTCAQLAFFLRTYALWGASRIVGVFLAVVASSAFVSGLILDVKLMRSTKLLQPPVQDKPAIVPNCFLIVDGQPEIAMWSVVIIITEDSRKFTILKQAQVADASSSASMINALNQVLMLLAIAAKIKLKYSLTLDSLVRKVYRDAIYYFIVNFRPLKQISGTFPSIMTRCIAAHVILRLREHSKDALMATVTGNSLGPLEFFHTELTEGRLGEGNGDLGQNTATQCPESRIIKS
ncbi:hypothetical protein NP233_g1139 [Leucocoprinus birnbaumii]|uniref:Uncharacterized protein n=1 Tax=Leucocoprinus birnbaumii TaxID=56174 RepID=A0AAD5W362_9AGAR|nr:hypothetical protein NP233_g1139 [Leucocoprinus birnbaumii]